MPQLVTNPHHHLTTLSSDMLCGVRRPMKLKSGFVLQVPLPRVHIGKIETVKRSRTDAMHRAIETCLNNGVGVRLPFGDVVWRFYARRITRSMLYALGRLKNFHDRHPSEEFAHLRDFNGPNHGEWARLRWWGLIEPKQPVEGDDNSPRGWWKLTGLGHRWLRGQEKIPRSPVCFHGLFVGWVDSTDLITTADVDPEFSLHLTMGKTA
jgi:hypothetical protein